MKRAMAQDKVKRNVVALCTVPTGQPGRPSKALTPPLADPVLVAVEKRRLHAYIALSTGVATSRWPRLTLADTAIAGVEGLDPRERTPRELRHSFVSPLSDSGVPLEEISRLVGHRSTTVTETVYRKQLRPVLQGGAVAMDSIFGSQTER